MPCQSQTTTSLDKFRFSLALVNPLKLKSSLQDIASQLHEVLGGRSTNSNRDAGSPNERSDLHRVTLSAFWGCLQHADEDSFPNVKQLLCIGCTLQVGSTDAERSSSAFRRIKTYLQSRMSQDSLLGLALMHVRHDLHVDTKEICQKYIQANRRRMFQSSIIRQSRLKGLPDQRTVLYS